MNDVAMLVFGGQFKRERRKRRDFDGWDNVGAYVVRDALEREGIAVGWCAPDAAHHYRLVLVSLTSPFDVFNFIQAVGRLSHWHKESRTFTVIAGGAGLQNVYPLRRLVDYAVFGRAETFVGDLVQAALANRDYHHESVMALREEVAPVVIAQAERPYPFPVKAGTFVFQEKIVGCPMRCNFCQYTYSRRWLGSQPSDYVLDGRYPGTKEGFFSQTADMLEDDPQQRVTTGLDGLSERLRFAFQKRIDNETVVRVIEEASARGQGKLARYKLYQIGSYPTETAADLEEFVEVISRPRVAGIKVLVQVHLTPFNASPGTPAAWLPMNFEHEWYKLGGQTIHQDANYHVWWSLFIESPSAHLLGAIAARATEESDELVEVLCFVPSLWQMRTSDTMAALSSQFDLSPYSRQYGFDEQIPTWYLSSYLGQDVIERASRRLHKTLGV